MRLEISQPPQKNQRRSIKRRASLVVLLAALVGLLAPATGYWRSSRTQYVPGIIGMIGCLRDCLWLGYGRYHPPIDRIKIEQTNLVSVLVKPTRLDSRSSAGMGECASVVENDRGTVLATWMMCDNRDGQTYKVFARRLRIDGKPASSEFRVNTGKSSGMLAHHVCLRVGTDGYFYVLWHAARTPSELIRGGSGVFMRVFNPDGLPSVPEVQVSSNLSGLMPELAVGPGGAAAAIWSDKGQIWARLLVHDGPAGPPVRLDDTPSGAVAEFPAIAFGPSGNLMAAWADTRGGGRDVYTRLLDPKLRPRIASIKAGDGPVPKVFFRLVSIAGTGAGYALIWFRPGEQRGRWFKLDGHPATDCIDILPATSEVASLALKDGSVLASNGRLIREWSPCGLGPAIPLLASPSKPNELSLASSREGIWLSWHDSIDARRIPALGDNFLIMAARVSLNYKTMRNSSSSPAVAKDFKN